MLKSHVPLVFSLDIPQTPCFAFTSSLLLLFPHVLLSALNLKKVLPPFFLCVFLVLKNPNKIVFQYRLMTSLLLPKKDCPLSLCSPKTTAVDSCCLSSASNASHACQIHPPVTGCQCQSIHPSIHLLVSLSPLPTARWHILLPNPSCTVKHSHPSN